jgi:hypothetical protein
MSITSHNITRPHKECFRLPFNFCIPKAFNFCIPKRKKVEIENLPKLSELGDSDSCEVVVLHDQKVFKKLQTRLKNILDKHITPEDCDKILNEQMQKNELQTIRFIYNGHISNNTNKETQSDDLSKNICGIIDSIIFSDLNIISKYNIIDKPLIQIGTQPSNKLHKDNGYNFNAGERYDYTIVIPLLGYDLSKEKKHNPTPKSTSIIPPSLKHKISGYDIKNGYRKSVFYNNASEEEKQYLVSEKLTQGTAIILHTATEANSDDDGKSVIHMSPEIEHGYLRCFIFVRANKKN